MANEYIPLATGSGANTISHAALVAANSGELVTKGFQPGIAKSEEMNAMLRMLSVAVAGMTNFIEAQSGQSLVDDGNPADITNKMLTALNNWFKNAYGQPGDVKATLDTNMSNHPGWLKMNGAAVSRTTYAALFAVIGTTYGAGDGSTTFNLPEARGEFFRNLDDGRGIDIGRTIGSFQAQAIQSHAHGGVPFLVSDTDRGTGNASSFSIDTVGSTETTGGNETRPRNIALLYLIKA